MVFLLSTLSMLGAFSIDAYLPSFHAIEASLHVSRAEVQDTLTIYLATFAFMMLFYGTLSDSFGRRPVILCAVTGYVIGSIGAAFAPNLGWLLCFRAVQGLSAGAGSVVGRAIVRDLFPGTAGHRMMAHITMVFSIAPAVAPVIGGWLQVGFGWRSVFVFLALLSLSVLITGWKLLPESLAKENRHPFHPGVILANYWRVGRHGPFLLQSIGIGLTFSGLSLYVSTAPDFIRDVLHLPETAFAWLFIPIITGMMSGSWCSAKLAGRISPDRMIWTSYGIMAFAGLINLAYMNLFIPEVPWAVLPPMVYMFGIAFASPAMALKTLDLFPRNRGLAASLQGFIQMMIFALVSGLVAPRVLGDAHKLSIGLIAGCAASALAWGLGTLRKVQMEDAG